MPDLVDNEDFCRPCSGTGKATEIQWRDGREVHIYSDCYYCRGTGKRTIRLDEVRHAR